MKKLLTLILVLMLVMIPTACAGQAGVEDAAAQGAEKDAILYFDAASGGWENASGFQLLLCDLDSGGSMKIAGTKGNSGLWLFGISDADIRIDHVYTVAFHHADTDDETYPLLLDTSCFGDTVYADNSVLENPSDDNEKLYEVHWKNSSLGPVLRITSIGNVVGDTVAANTSAYQMFVDFLASKGEGSLTYSLWYSGRDAQSTIDTVAGALGLTKEDVAKAIKEAGSIGNSVTGDKIDWSHEWDASKFSIPEGSDKNGSL